MSSPPQHAPRFSLGDLLSEIQTTATELAVMTDKVATLEAANSRLEKERDELNAELTEVEIRAEAANAVLQTTTQRADRAEAGAAAYSDRAYQISADIGAANDDIASITAAISNLRAQRQQRRQR